MTRREMFDRNLLAIQELLESWGINPDDVAQFGLTAEGYFVFARDAFGRKIPDAETNSTVKHHREWPEGFPVDVFFGFVHAWKGAVK